jgi:integrase
MVDGGVATGDRQGCGRRSRLRDGLVTGAVASAGGVVGRSERQRRWEVVMEPVVLLDAAGRRRSAATMTGHRRGQAPRNKGVRYPADPPSVEEIVLVMRHAGDRAHGLRVRGLIVVMWRAGLRISEALALTERDVDVDRGAILVRHGNGDKRREVGMDQWGWELLRPWLAYRVQIPVGPLFCVIDGRTRGRPLSTTSVRQQLRRTAAKAGVRRRFAPHQLRHAHAVEMARQGVPLNVIQRPTRPREPRDHVRLPPRHRQRRDHRHRPRAPCPHDPRQLRTAPPPVDQRARTQTCGGRHAHRRRFGDALTTAERRMHGVSGSLRSGPSETRRRGKAWKRGVRAGRDDGGLGTWLAAPD